MFGYEEVKDDLETLASHLFCNPDFQDPLLYVSDICSSHLVSSSVVNHVLNKLLLNDYVSVNLPNISVFLQNLSISLELEGPCKYNYKDAVLNPSDDFPDLWSILTHLINSSFSHHRIHFKQKSQHQLVQYPLCDLLLHFYVDYILKFLSLKRDLFEDCYEERCIILMRWISAFYRFHKQQVEIVKDLQSLLEHTINNEINCDIPSVALNRTALSRFVLKILKFCDDCFTGSSKFLNFLNSFKSEHISASLCYHLLNSLTGKKEFLLTERNPLTLKEMVHCFFFVNSSEMEEKYLVKTSKEKVRKKNIEILTDGDEELHDLCRRNLFDNLLLVLSKEECANLNIRNLAQQTPLHVASLSSSYLCAKLLLDSVVSKANRVDLAAVDMLSCTPLHYAILANDISITKMLIEHGGTELLYKQDCYGLKPFEYVNSIEMRHALQNLHPSFEINGVDFDVGKFEASTVKGAEYSLYLSALHSLLCDYFNIYHLHQKRGFDIVEHGECGHFVPCSSNKMCIVDYSFVYVIPKLISDLVEHSKTSEVYEQVLQFSLLCDILINSVCP